MRKLKIARLYAPPLKGFLLSHRATENSEFTECSLASTLSLRLHYLVVNQINFLCPPTAL